MSSAILSKAFSARWRFGGFRTNRIFEYEMILMDMENSEFRSKMLRESGRMVQSLLRIAG